MNPMAGMGRPPAMGGMPSSMGAAPMSQAPTPQMGGTAPSTGNVMQITSTLRGMSDQQLQQYASMHKSDPFVFPLAFQESQTRQQMRAGQAAQMAGQKPPPVVDQDLAQMSPQPLPEEQGIGAIPAQNLQRMADGGIAGYADGGQQPGMFNYAQMAPAVDLHPNSGVTPRSMAAGGIAHFADQGIVKGDYPPGFIENFYRTLDLEGGLGYDKRGGTTKYGISKKAYPNLDIGNLTKDEAARIYKKDYWDKINGDRLHEVNPALAATLFDAAVNQGVGKAHKYLTASNGDPYKIIDMRRADYADLAKREPEVHGKQLTGWNKRLDKLTTAILPAANAETVPGRAPVNSVDQIPGQNVKAPASNYEQTNTYFGGLADRLGISPEVQRNISNSLNALGGYSSPISSVGRGVGTASRALEPTAEMIAKAEQAKNAVALPRIAGPSKVFEGLTPEAQAMRDSAVQARQLRALEADKQAALGAEQSVNAATQTSDIARKMEESIANARRVGATAKIPGTEKAITLGGRLNEAKMSGAAQGLAAMNDMEKMGLASTATEPQYPNENGPEDRWNMPAPSGEKGQGLQPDKPTGEGLQPNKPTGEGLKPSRNWDDIMLHTGLGLLAGKSPYALQNLGEAGLNALQMERAQTKEDREQKLAELHGKYYESAGKKAEAEANYLENEKSNTALIQKATAVTEQSLKAWMDSQANNGVPIAPEDIRAMRAQLYKQTLGMMGLQIPSTMASNGPTPGAIQVLGVRPS